MIDNNSIHRFTTSSFSISVFENICQSADIRAFVSENFKDVYRHIDFALFENAQLEEIYTKLHKPLVNMADEGLTNSTLVVKLEEPQSSETGKVIFN